MAAYAAAISLKHMLTRILPYGDREILELLPEELTSVQEVLKRSDAIRSSRRNALADLDGRIRDAIYKLEDVIESHVSNQMSAEKELISFEDLREEMSFLIEDLKKMKDQYGEELDNPEEEANDDVSLSLDFDEKKYVNVGSGCFVKDIKEVLTQRMSYEFGVVSIVGVGGTGRSIVARAAFEHRYVRRDYDTRTWATVGPRYEVKQILTCLLSQIGYEEEEEEEEEKLAQKLYDNLKGRKYVVVLDNVSDTKVWDCLRRSFPPENNGSRVLLTTSVEEVALFADSFNTYRKNAFSDEESWDLIRELVFDGEECCPLELEEAGKKIAENCKGLCLEVIKVVFLLSEAEKTTEYWNKVAAEKPSYFFQDAYDEMSLISQITEHLQLDNMLHGYDDNVSSRTYFAKVIEKVLEPRSALVLILDDLFQPNLRQRPTMVSLSGMAGIGKSALAKKIFEDPLISDHFDHRVWITLGPKYRYSRILSDILVQVDPYIAKMPIIGDEVITEHFCTLLSSKRCLFVLDDVWDKEPLRYLVKLFKDIKFKVLVTTRLKEIAQFSTIDYVSELRLLNKEESWRLLCKYAFGEMSCPRQFEKPGRIIAENCEGLPLMIVTIAGLLSQPEKTLEFWNMVAKKNNPVFKLAYDKILHILLPSYEYLPQHLKASFLYMGVVPQKYDIPTSKLFRLWSSEEILELDFPKYLKQLVSRSLLLTPKKNYRLKIKSCRLHSVFWHLCIREASNAKFFHIVDSNLDDLAGGINGQRRLCIHNNVLFTLKDVHASMTSNSTVRSLLCTGQYHQYLVPICSSFTLLRILDALTIRFYEFPVEVIEQVQLRYLSLTCNKNLPASISRLWNLQHLIVGEHLSSKLCGAQSYLPKEIWDMKQLKHLQVTGRDLPDPCGAVLPNLSALLDVSHRSCTNGALQGTPNLQKLGIQIELEPNGAESLYCFDHISHLHRLESLKCVVMNPEFRFNLAPPRPSISMFPPGLKKLSLSGLGYPWEYMTVIGKLRNLEVLKLRNYAFQGPNWVMNMLEFYVLRYLLIEDTDLMYWKADFLAGIDSLSHVIIKHCYKLQEIPIVVANSHSLHKWELIDCNPSAPNLIPVRITHMRRPDVHSSMD